jgi:ABC-type branched-subunit amino acid transport system permease subunit
MGRRGRVSVDLVVLQTLNGLTFGALLFLLASGFTLVYGLMRIVNLAHGALYLTGGYVAGRRDGHDRELPDRRRGRASSRRPPSVWASIDCSCGGWLARSCRRSC